MLRARRVENLRHGALTTTAGTREGSTITATASPHPARVSTGTRTRTVPNSDRYPFSVYLPWQTNRFGTHSETLPNQASSFKGACAWRQPD